MVRFLQHRRSCRSSKPTNPKLAAVWKKHGEPKLEVLIKLNSEDEMVEYEQHLIDQNFGNEKFLNLSPIAGRPPSNKGMKRNPMSVAKTVAAKIGIKHSLEARAKMSAAKANPIIAVDPTGNETIYSSGNECARQTGFDQSIVSRLIRSGKSGAKGKIKGWSFRKS